MVTDGNIIKEARFFVKAYSKEFCQIYSDLCGSPFAECIKSALDGQLRIAESLKVLKKHTVTKPSCQLQTVLM